jgi:hypothetical protein
LWGRISFYSNVFLLVSLRFSNLTCSENKEKIQIFMLILNQSIRKTLIKERNTFLFLENTFVEVICEWRLLRYSDLENQSQWVYKRANYQFSTFCALTDFTLRKKELLGIHNHPNWWRHWMKYEKRNRKLYRKSCNPLTSRMLWKIR